MFNYPNFLNFYRNVLRGLYFIASQSQLIQVLCTVDVQKWNTVIKEVRWAITVPFWKKNLKIRYTVQCKTKENWKYGTIKHCTSFTNHQILSEQLKQQGCDGQGTYEKWAAMKYSEKPQIPNFEGSRSVERTTLWWMDGMVDNLRKFGIKRWWIVARGTQLWNRDLLEAEVCFGP